MLILRYAQEFWPNMSWTTRLFEWVVAQKGLLGRDEPEGSSGALPKQDHVSDLPDDSNPDRIPDPDIPLTDNVELDAIEESTGWIQDFLGFGFMDGLDMPRWEG